MLVQIYIFGRAQAGSLTRYCYSFVIFWLREWTCVMNNLFCRREYSERLGCSKCGLIVHLQFDKVINKYGGWRASL